ncbi:dienelactone hydrolase family protein [Caldimonas brevitalea]|uniref:Carboxymethylenebutenolidase n=1 Tax=Caldimonas brevitalea TaxID=413882 RepID=A0A0G3BN37_9BURK|nr:dienelactone hydrolase family protein [Caldimonas brevitalea]AKJ29403.1 carboxymethylenebutenolidase [Caldimonas brevitalea]
MTLARDTSAFATAVQPVAADTVILTPADGLVAGLVQIATPTGDLPAYRAAPDRPGPHPVVLVIQEIFGVHEHIRDVARRLAHLGYLAVAPELYFRQGDAARAPSIERLREDIVAKVPDVQVLADLDATLAWATAQGGDADRVAVTGFCWGGRITWLYAAHQPAVKTGVAWYGRLTGPTSELAPRHPLDVAATLKAPVLGLYGGQDTGIPLAHVEQLQAALAQAGSPSKIHVYPDAPHAFFADYRPSYRAEAAADGWQRLQRWLAGHGVGPR